MAGGERVVLLHRRPDSSGLGFSLLGTPHLPPIIYDILENSPAAESGEVEAGDVIVKINETHVDRFTTKEVLKCLRLSGDPVRLQLKRDPEIKQQVIHLLQDMSDSPPQPTSTAQVRASPENLESEDPFPVDADLQKFNNKPKAPRFEAFMMTGDLILNLSRNQQTAGLLPKQSKKIDSLRNQRHRAGNVNSVPTSPSEGDLGGRRCESPLPSSLADDDKPYAFQTGVRTSKSEDHLQFQKDSSLSTVDIDIDEDVTSSLNTLLDTRQDSSCGSLSFHDNQTLSDPSSNVTVLQITEDGWTNQSEAAKPAHSQSDAAKPLANQSESSQFENAKNECCCASQSKLAKTVNNQSDSGGGACACSPLREKRRSGRWDKENRHSGHFDKEHRHSGHFDKCEHRHSAHCEKSEHRRSGHYDREHRNSGHYDKHHIKPSGSSSDLSTPSPGHSASPPTSPASSSFHPSDPSASNISSPDYHEEMTLDLLSAMEMTDPSDSDSTIMVSERGPRSRDTSRDVSRDVSREDARVVCYVDPPEPNRTNGFAEAAGQTHSSPPHSHNSTDEDCSDVDSLESFHYSPKAVDIPSAVRLAKRLYNLDGFKKSDVSRHLSKNNEFSKAVAEEYLRYFEFTGDTLDVALRKFLKQFALIGETQERERVLVHFSKRYLDCNPNSYNSADAVHTLTCAIMLLNTDLHGQNLSRKMTCEEFIENLRDLNDGENFPRDSLKALYRAIVYHPVEWALDPDDEPGEGGHQMDKDSAMNFNAGGNPFLSMPDSNAPAVEYKKGYVMRKCCYEVNGKRTPFGKRGWKMMYCTLRDMILYLHKDDHGYRKANNLSYNILNSIRIHHALATRALDYTKKQYVFKLETADRAQYLFQTSDSKELQSWVDTINAVAASFSSPPLSSAVGSSDKFQRPLLPSSLTKLSLNDQLLDHEDRLKRLNTEMEEHKRHQPDKHAKSLLHHNYKEKYNYLQHEVIRYGTYIRTLRNRMACYDRQEEEDEVPTRTGGHLVVPQCIVPPPVPDRPAYNNGLSILKTFPDR